DNAPAKVFPSPDPKLLLCITGKYYETKGLAIILETLTKMFVQSKILSMNLCTSQSSSQYLAQVLVPKTAIRLIAKDFNNISLDTTKKIMIDSIEFGLYVHDDDDNTKK
ncbi:2895_t:CDS:2, partial [Cetraspora pellucida]